MSTDHIREGARFLTTRAIEANSGPRTRSFQLEAGTLLRHVRSSGWWSGNIEYADYFFEVEDGPLTGNEICIFDAQVNGPPEPLTEVAASRGLELVTEADGGQPHVTLRDAD